MRNVLGSSYDELIRVVRYARQRWRIKVALRGVVLVLAFGFVAFALSVWGMDRFHYAAGAVRLFQVLTYVALLGLVVRFLVLPLSRRVSEEQVALYIEEHEPSLDSHVLSAVELGSLAEGENKASSTFSQALVKRLVASAIEGCQEIDYAHQIEQKSLRKFSGLLAGVAAAGMTFVLLSPAFLQHGAMLLFLPWKGGLAVDNPYQIEVLPGNLAVPRGADQQVAAHLVGFDADRVEIGVRSTESGPWERFPMSLEEEGEHVYMFLNLQHESEYFVEAAGVRSPLYRIEVMDVPYVERLDLEYRFPAYTGLSPERVEDGGDIAALRGTQVLIRVTPTIPVPAGQLVLEGQEDVPLEREADGTLLVTLEVREPSFYKVELEGPDGELHAASPEYAIEVLADQPPVIRFSKPGRDSKAHKIEEVFAEVTAEDDYGLGQLELVYSVNGGEETGVDLYHRRGQGGKKQLVAGYTFFLEEYGLEDGDFVSYFARARDGRAKSQAQTTTTDIFFIEVRPFSREYRQAQQGGMSGGGGGLDSSLSLRQRQIIAATFKLVRDREDYSKKEYSENLATLALLQERLREQVETLVRRMQNRGPLLGDSEFRKIIGSLTESVTEMEPAAKLLGEEKPQEALPPEQRALKHLQRAEAVFRDVRVSFQSGGAGGASQQLAEDLADLFELELDKLRNQYEMVERGERQQVENKVDEALQKLKELARRQQQENERARRRAARLQQSGGGGGGAQRDLMDEAEKMARRLERLARENSRPDLMEASRRLQEAADSMKRSMANNASGRGISQQAQALERLEETRRLLEKNREFQLGRDMEEVESRAQRIGELQEKITSQVGELDPRGDGAEYAEQMARLLERKDQLAREVKDLESDLDRVAREAKGEHKEASRELQGAANSIRDNQLKEKIRYSRGVVRGRTPDYAKAFEEEIGSDVQELQEKIGEAGKELGQSEKGQLASSLERARDLVQGLESLEARLRERQEAAQQPGRQGDSGEERGEDSPGQEGEQRAAQDGAPNGQPGDEGQGSQPGTRPGEGGEQGSRGGNTSRIGTANTEGYQPGIYGLEDLRQLDREFKERLREGRELRDTLRQQDVQVADLDDILRKMSRFNVRGINNDPLALGRLKEGVIEGLRQFEYRLWRELEQEEPEKLYLRGSDEVPTGYRELVDEYFKALSASDN